MIFRPVIRLLLAAAPIFISLLCAVPVLAEDVPDAPEAPDAPVSLVEVRFTGQAALTESELRKAVKTKARRDLDVEVLKADADRLVRLYEDHGFMQAKVVATVDPRENGKGDVLTFDITEGARFRVREIEFAGNTLFTTEELRPLAVVERDGFFSKGKLMESAEQIHARYGNTGRLTTAVVPSTGRIDLAQALLSVRITIQEGPPVVLKSLVIEWTGQQVTWESLIRRELDLREGQPLTYDEVETAVARLRRAGWFKNVRYDVRPEPDAPEQVTLAVIVEEARTARVGIGGSAATATGLGLNLSFAERNFDIANWPATWEQVKDWDMFRGRGETFSVVLNPSTKFSIAALNFSHPYFFDTPYAILADGLLRIQELRDYDLFSIEGRVGLSRSLGEHLSLSFGPAVQMTRISDIDRRDIPDYVEAEGATVGYGAWTTLAYDTVPVGLVPSRGLRASFTLEPMHVDTTFLRLTGSVTRFFPLYGEAEHTHVLELTARAGARIGEAPFFERFYAGGQNSVRGFDIQGISPRVKEVVVGGDALYTARAEYGFPLYELGDDLIFRGAAFIDAGDVEKSWLDMGKPRVGAGLGFRILIRKLPGFGAAFDFAAPLLRQREDDVQVFSFLVGLGF